MIYFTAVGLPPGGSSTVHIYTKQYIEQHNRHNQYIELHNSLIRKSAERAPSLRGKTRHMLYNRGKSTEKLSHGSRRMPVGTMKTEFTEQSIQTIRINKHNNENT